ncbi:MAG: hypothetical protein RLZZ330_688 [Actinomycetota bacterium]|jgi:ribosomal protein S18 acetylase RimI-like enzyme
MKRFNSWDEYKPHAHWNQIAMITPQIFVQGWVTDSANFCLAELEDHTWLTASGDVQLLDYAKILNEAASMGHVVTMVSLPTAVANQLNFENARDVVWMRRAHPFPPKSVSPNVEIVTDGSADSEIQRLLQLSAPDSSVWPGNPEILFWTVVRNSEKEIVGAAAGVKWQTGAYVVSSVSVAESARRHGIGSLVTLTTAQELFARGAETVNLGVRATNRGALAMYQAIGFDEQFDFTRAVLTTKE